MLSEANSISYEFEGFRVDAGKRLLLGARGQAISLTPKVFDTLLYLVRHSGNVIEKDELMSAIWPDTIVEENNLNKNISTLRRVLGENPGEHRFIATVPGKGYKFVASVNEPGTSPEAPVDIAIPNSVEYQRPDASMTFAMPFNRFGQVTEDNRPSRFWFLAIAFAAFAGLGVLGFFSWREVPGDVPITSVAVLPFVNVGADAEWEYLPDGLSENLIDRLSELTQLKVISRSSSFKYRDENVDIQEVARNLRVQAIVTGRVARRGDDLIIRVELIDARDNKQLWGEQFNRKTTDALAIEGEIAKIISSKLRLKLTGEQEQQVAKGGTRNPQAYDLLLKGAFAERRGGTENSTKAIEFYQQAISLDPNYALAYAKLSHTYGHLAGNSRVNPKNVASKALSAAKKAVELDENLAEAHLELANLARDAWDWQQADYEYRRALELNPSLVAAHLRYSSYLSIMGRHDQAIVQGGRAKELDPLTLFSHQAVPFALLASRQFDESIAETRKTLELRRDYVPAHVLLGQAYGALGMYDEAIAAYKEVMRITGDKELSYYKICLGAAYARAGEREKAEAILRELESNKEYVSPGELPILYAALGNFEKAFASLETAFTARDLQLQNLNADPGFDLLRGEPRFQDLQRRIGLPQ